MWMLLHHTRPDEVNDAADHAQHPHAQISSCSSGLCAASGPIRSTCCSRHVPIPSLHNLGQAHIATLCPEPGTLTVVRFISRSPLSRVQLSRPTAALSNSINRHRPVGGSIAVWGLLTEIMSQTSLFSSHTHT